MRRGRREMVAKRRAARRSPCLLRCKVDSPVRSDAWVVVWLLRRSIWQRETDRV